MRSVRFQHQCQTALSTKRFLQSDEVTNFLKKLRCRTAEIPEHDRARYRELLEDVRQYIDKIGREMSFPLLGGRHASFDHLEALLTEYNYLSKLILDGRLKIGHATELGVKNFDRMYPLLFPIIELRDLISPGYASHFAKYAGEHRELPIVSVRLKVMDEDDKRQFDALLELAKFHQDKWGSRRQNEWRISFGVWTMLVGTAYVAYSVTTKQVPFYASLPLAIAVVMLHAYILDRIRMRNREDAWFTRFYLIQAEKVVTDAALTRLEGQQQADWKEWWRSLRGNYSVQFQIVSTIILACAAVYISGLRSLEIAL